MKYAAVSAHGRSDSVALDFLLVNRSLIGRPFGRPATYWVEDPAIARDADGDPIEDWGQVFGELPPNAVGEYVFTWQTGSIQAITVAVRAGKVLELINRPEGGGSARIEMAGKGLSLLFTGVKGPIKGRMLRHASHSPTQLISPWALAAYSPFKFVRFMDTCGVNFNQPYIKGSDGKWVPAPRANPTYRLWKNRVKLSSPSWRNEWPIEAVVQAAHEMKLDFCYLNVPHTFSPDSYPDIVAVIRGTLQALGNSRMKVLVEISNETWNYSSPYLGQRMDLNYWSLQDIRTKTIANEKQRVAAYTALLTAHFGEACQGDKQIAAVFAGQWADPSVLRWGLEAVDAFFTPEPSALIGYLMVAPYFGLTIKTEINNPLLTVDACFGKWKGGNNMFLDAAVAAAAGSEMVRNLAVAEKYKIPLGWYEGGHDFTTQKDSPQNITLINAVRDPRMGEVVKAYLQAGLSLGVKNVMYFPLTHLPSQGAVGGLMEDIFDLTDARYRAASDVAIELQTQTPVKGKPVKVVTTVHYDSGAFDTNTIDLL